jgi:hypothetical protein
LAKTDTPPNSGNNFMQDDNAARRAHQEFEPVRRRTVALLFVNQQEQNRADKGKRRAQ